jgi:hypothetical protein
MENLAKFSLGGAEQSTRRKAFGVDSVYSIESVKGKVISALPQHTPSKCKKRIQTVFSTLKSHNFEKPIRNIYNRTKFGPLPTYI